MLEAPVRVREDERVRDIDLICDEEIARAAVLLVDAQIDINLEDLSSQTARVLGFASTGSRIAERISRVINMLLSEGSLETDDTGQIVVSAQGK